MTRAKTVGVKELKNKLSAYLREVRSGGTIWVTDHATVVAELREPYIRAAAGHSAEALILDWVNAGTLTTPRISRKRLSQSPVRLRHKTALSLLESDKVGERE